MKLIGVAGSCGKTSVAEILYQFLLFKKNNVSLYSSNGFFVNGLTKVKDFLQTTVYDKDLKEMLNEDEESGVEYVIIEITAESVNRKEEVYELPYEVIGFTNFIKGLNNNFNSYDEYLSCKRKLLGNSNAKTILLRKEDPNYELFCDIPHKTYGYAEDVDYRLQVIDNTIDGLSLMYDNVFFTSNLITGYHARNIACALAILNESKLLDINEFKDFANSIKIRGRFEKLNINDKTVFIDTGLVGTGILLVGLETILKHRNFKIVFSNYHYDYPSQWVKNSRKRVGEYLRWGKFIYLTNPEGNPNEESIFLEDVMCEENYNNFTYIPDYKEAVSTAIGQLKDNEVLVIIARNNYRLYRNYLEEIDTTNIMGGDYHD